MVFHIQPPHVAEHSISKLYHFFRLFATLLKLRDMSLHNYPQILCRNKQRIEKNERSDRIIMRLESYGWNS